jgi:pyruvate/2-oxoglutarate/acetoin dehydrogenase E1 component
MSKPQTSIYKDALTEAMTFLGQQDDTVFIGQQIVYAGNPMSTTLVNVDKDKMIEVPVMEETQMGMSLGIGIMGQTVVSFYPRWNFLICAANQMINHVDKYKEMTGKTANIIIRVANGADEP